MFVQVPNLITAGIDCVIFYFDIGFTFQFCFKLVMEINLRVRTDTGVWLLVNIVTT